MLAIEKRKEIIPFCEQEDPDVFWRSEAGDQIIPQPGFISDFVYYTRGVESPTEMCVWGALFALAGTIRREAWIDMGPTNPLFPNLYVIFVGPAGIVKKSTGVVLATKIYEDMYTFIKNPVVRAMKARKGIIKGSVTPEAIVKKLSVTDEKVPVLDAQGNMILHPTTQKPVEVPQRSEGMIIAGELGSLLNKRSYNETMITLLLKLFDENEHANETIGRGEEKLRDVWVSLFGGTTPSGFQHAIPSSALSDGFLSRTTLVYKTDTEREYPSPRSPIGAPSREELAERLAYIAENTIGEQCFTDEAEELYDEWYHKFKLKLKGSSERMQGYMSRNDITVKKIAMLVSAQRYKTDNLITTEDLKDAIRIVEHCDRTIPPLLGRIAGKDEPSILSKVSVYIENRGGVYRRQILQNTRYCADEVHTSICYLHSMGKIIVKESKDGEVKPLPTREGGDYYEWVEDVSD